MKTEATKVVEPLATTQLLQKERRAKTAWAAVAIGALAAMVVLVTEDAVDRSFADEATKQKKDIATQLRGMSLISEVRSKMYETPQKKSH